jgi:NADPH:quinone reductase-like Zn-dependent oxidoreductase
MSNKTMQAVRFHEYGGLEELVFEQAPRPQPQADQVLIHLVAAGVNPADGHMRAGFYKEFMPVPLPWVLGLEGAGIVEAVGENVTKFQPGQAVFGLVTGGYAEYAVAAASEVQLKSAHLTFEEAASVPMGALTAWGAVIDAAHVQAGQRVLVHGTAGGVGVYVVQLARWKGARVIGTSSARNSEFVRSLGAEEAIDYNATPFETVVRDVDVVVDTVGGEVTERSWQVLKQGGILVTVAARLAADAGQAHGVRAAAAMRASPEKLKDISELLEAKQLTPVVGTRFTLAEARQAQELSQTRHGRGRIILLTA